MSVFHLFLFLGKKFIGGTTTVVLVEITKKVKDMIRYAEVISVGTPEQIQKLKDKLTGAMEKLLNFSSRMTLLEQVRILIESIQ